MSDLLLEGGVAGHMNHLYDNGDLTFAKLKEIFAAAAEGKLEGTEKTDGQNLMISFSVKEGRAKGVRNKGEIKGGGLTPEQLAAKFADRANPALKETFSDALRAFEKAIQSLDHDEQVELFGPDTNIYYNAEVMDPRAPNVINYDTKTLVIHRVGHGEFDRATGKKTETDVSDKAKKLEDIIKDAQEKIKDENYGLQVNAIKRLKALSDKRPLNTANNKINVMLSSVNNLIGNEQLSLSDNSTIDEFMMARIYILLNSILKKGGYEKITPLVKMSIAKNLLGVGGISALDIKKKISKEEYLFVKENILNSDSKKQIYVTAIQPLEAIVSDFAVDMLRGLKSAYILDNEKEVQRLKKEVQVAIDAIEKSGNEEAMDILKRQMSKLRSADRVSATAEGFVFDYDGVTYKFTGNFAPVNQILGLFKYGRGSVPALKKDLEEVVKKPKGMTVAVIPGAFKPPHKGHLDMVKQYAREADKVIVFISPMARELEDGTPVTFDASKKIWDMYLKAAALTNKVDVMQSPFSSPVRAAYEFVGNQDNRPEFAQSGQTVILGTSTKGGDEERFARDAKKYAKEGVNVLVKPMPPLESLSATDMRKAIFANNVSELVKFLPDELRNKENTAKDIIKLFKLQINKKINENMFYDIIIETITKRGDKYCLISKKSKKNLGCYGSKGGAEKRERQVQYFKHAKEENMATGSVAGYGTKLEDKMES